MNPTTIHQATPFTHVDTELLIQFDPEASRRLGKNYWRVTQCFNFYIGQPSDDLWVLVPAGFLTDGATVPRPFWGLVPPWGWYGQAAVVHDWLCENGVLYQNGQRIPITRARGDAIFKEAMRAAGVGYWTRSVMYWGVRLFSKLQCKPDAVKRARKRSLQASYIGNCAHCQRQ